MRRVIMGFSILAISLFISLLSVPNPFLQFATQFNKYLFIFLFTFIINKYACDHRKTFDNLYGLFFYLIMIQVFMSIVKLLLLGIEEAIVGTISYTGGASATVLPILGYLIIWIRRNGKIAKSDWLIIISLLIIPIASDKRAIWFMFPFALIVTNYYIRNIKLPIFSLFVSIMLVPIIFYVGLRLNPSLNPEHKIWGSFNIDYALNYSNEYTFGDQRFEDAHGRGAGLIVALSEAFDNLLLKQTVFGNGVNKVYEGDYLDFKFQDLSIRNKASAGGAVRVLLAFGLFSMITLFYFGYSVIRTVENRRLLHFILIFFVWEYFLYLGVLIGSPAISVVLIYSIVLSNTKMQYRL